METITFYSYKGGVGRTLALANIAVYLSRFDQSVCIIDFDLEAPGIPYKLPEFFSSPIETGLVDYIYEFTSTGTVSRSLHKFLLNAQYPGPTKKYPSASCRQCPGRRILEKVGLHRLARIIL
jgi:hypothetical protein